MFMLNRYTVSRATLPWLVVLVAVILPRLAVLGTLPSTDEGIYAYFAQIMYSSLASGHGLPDSGTLMLYPMIVSWVFDLPLNNLLTLRVVDLIITASAGVLFYKLIEKESRSTLAAIVISLIFLFTMNHPAFIQSGFKNSIFAAYIPLFIAMLWAEKETHDLKKWFWIGSLCALSVLLRETFIPFVAVASLAIFISYGWKSLIRFSLGGILTGVLIIIAVLAARGGAHSFIDAYVNAGDFYASLKDQTLPLFIEGGSLSARLSTAPLLTTGIAITGLLINSLYKRSFENTKRCVFWASIAAVPLLEPLSKIGFPYHFAVCLPGLAGLCALSWRLILQHKLKLQVITVVATIAICVPLLKPQITLLNYSWLATKDNLTVIYRDTWSKAAINQSNYLLAADAIMKAAPPDGTLAVSGYMFSLFPLTGLLPPAYEANHLNGMIIKYGFDEDRFLRALEACPPDVLMTSTRTEIPGSEIVKHAVESSKLYTAVAEIPVAPEKSYGTFAGTVYKRVGAAVAKCDASSL